MIHQQDARPPIRQVPNRRCDSGYLPGIDPGEGLIKNHEGRRLGHREADPILDPPLAGNEFRATRQPAASAIGDLDAVENPEERALPGAVPAEQPDDLRPAHLEADVFQGSTTPVGFGDVLDLEQGRIRSHIPVYRVNIDSSSVKCILGG